MARAFAPAGLGHPHAQPPPRSPPSAQAPRPKQLGYLRALANNRGQTFTYPRTKAQASAEIRRLEALPAQDWRDHAAKREQLASTHIPEDAARVRAGEITGYGANARWTHNSTREERS